MPKHYYRRSLPHLVPPGALLFITFRLAGSLPAAVLAALRQERQAAKNHLAEVELDTKERMAAALAMHKRLFARYDKLLDQCSSNTDWLRQPAIAKMVAAKMHRLAALDVTVHCFCIMPNHVHLLVQLPEDESFSFAKMMQLLKGRTAAAANRLLNRNGQPFWQPESYDHLVRSPAECERVKTYIVHNPVKAGLVASWELWPFSFLAE